MESTQDKPARLLRQLGLVSATALVVSNMVGSGIFTATGFLAGDLAQVPVVLAIWIVGALCALAGALAYSELGINFPASGGEYVYLTQAYGPTWGFMTGWVSLLAGFSAPIALSALGFANYLGYFWPGLKQENVAVALDASLFQVRLGGAQAAAASLIAVFTVLNFFGVHRIARIQNVLTSIKILVLLAFILLGLAVGTGSWGHFSQDATRTSSIPLPAQFAMSLFFIYVSYSGWNAAAYVAEEVKQPERTLPRALFLGTLLVAVLYVGLNIVFIYGVPLEKMKGVVAVGSLAASHLFGPEVAGIFSALMAVSLVSTVNAMVVIGPRVYYAMAKNRAFFSAAAHVDRRWHTPTNAILIQGVCAILLTLTSLPDLFFYIGITLNFFAVMSVASLFKFRRRPGWQKLPAVSFAWPLIPAFFILVGLWITAFGIWFGMQTNPKVTVGSILTVAGGALIYHFRTRSAPAPAPDLS
ncbi:MAG: amino acid permease [Bryobacteraceae bacterium]|nr:amino acid permease [Bryobacteraceae bacterium]